MMELFIALIICGVLIVLIAALAKTAKMAAESRREKERWEAIKRELDEFEDQFSELRKR